MSKLPDGRYAARPLEAVLDENSNGKERVCILCEVMEDEHAGVRLTYQGYFTTEKGIAQQIKTLKICGWNGEERGGEWDLSVINGTAEIDISVSTNDRSYTEINYINERGGGGGVLVNAPMDQAKKKSFAARMKGHVIAELGVPKPATKPTAAKPAAKQPVPASRVVDDSDIPF